MQLYNEAGHPNNITLKNSYFHDNSLSGNGGCVTFYGNNHVSYNNQCVGSSTDGSGGTYSFGSGTNGQHYNNTIYVVAGHYGVENRSGSGHVFRNNIVSGTFTGSCAYGSCTPYLDNGGGSGNIFDYNLCSVAQTVTNRFNRQ
jgi:hypothetical protein